VGLFSYLIEGVKNKGFILFVFLLITYFCLHLFKLTNLPVFADEAIYIRWSQLIIDDFNRYLFYPMNDGKTPLLMWLTVPFLKIFSDQLYASRLVSVLAGALSVVFIFLILKKINEKKAGYIAMFLSIIAPFTFFHHRLAITDALLFLNLTISYYFSLKIVKHKNPWSILGLAFFFFLSIMSKTPALLFLPVFYLTIFFEEKLNFKFIFNKTLRISFGLLIAGLSFYSFKIVPLFSQLFAVGGNFLQSSSVIFSREIFTVASRNSIFFLENLFYYLGPIILILAIPIFTQTRRKQGILFLSGIVFLLPLVLLGKIIYSRYALPSSLFFISSAAISINNLKNKKILQYLALLLIVVPSFIFIKNAYFNVDQLQLSKVDRSQYLEEWSSGHGIKEATVFIEELAKTQKVAVATEGYFGTLPDGILLNLHNKNVDNIYVEGIGQPVREIPNSFLDRADQFDLKLLVVNSHRLMMDLPPSNLLKSFCRPNEAPCLQVWEIKK
jgi:4-amino-4-deoxy-L-arabinose transferase-like glycosyltransferase